MAKFHQLATKKKELQIVHMFFCGENGSKVAILIYFLNCHILIIGSCLHVAKSLVGIKSFEIAQIFGGCGQISSFFFCVWKWPYLINRF